MTLDVVSTGEKKRERLRQLLEKHAAEGSRIVPLSYNQASLWFLHAYDPDTSAYSVGFAATVRAPLDVDALRRALQRLTARHPALRTGFMARAGRPFQHVRGEAALPLEERDASGWDDATLERRVADDYERPFDLSRPPAVRATLYHRGEGDPVLLLVVHHTLADLWSLSLLLGELGALYDDPDADLPALPADYGHFVRWQTELLGSAEGERQRAYWQAELEGATTVLNLPTDHPRPPLQTLRGRSVAFTFDAELSAAVGRLAREELTSPYAMLLAAFQVLLGRYAEQDDVLVGSPVAGRTRGEFDGVVGHFVNMIVLRGRLSPNLSFRGFLQQVRDRVLGALDHQDYPFAALVEALQVPRDASRPALFQACFAFQRAPKLEGLTGFMVRAEGAPPLRLGSLELSPFPLAQQEGQFDLSLWMADAEGRLHGEFKYQSDLFEHATAERMARHFETLVRAAVAEPDRPLGALPLLDAEERTLVVDEWNRTERPYRRDACLHQLFEEQTDRTPEALAGVFEQRAITYAELEAQANRIAHLLRDLGVGRGGLVAVYLDRALEMLPALIGVHKAGAGYVPLEPSYPRSRTEVILSSLPIRAVVTQARHTAALQALDAPLVEHLVVLDDGVTADGPRRVWTPPDLRAMPAARPPAVARPEDTAYIIFTSGSTGTPKGVEVVHRPAVNLIEWVNTTYAVGQGDRLLFVTSPCFDLSVYDVFGSLAAGATVHVASADELRDPDRLVRLLVEEPITFWDSAPPALAQLVPFLPDRAPDSRLRLVFLSGDWIPVRLPDQIRNVFPRAHVVSLGGATEATIWSNSYDIGPVDPSWPSIPYGKPIQNARYYILDPTGEPCPIGVPGDLYIGGECLAEGYVNDPDLTAAKFVPDPFCDRPDARMYRTGDRARFFPDGNIEFLGRQDFQVKIRGYRIELGEIEAVLSSHAAVADCLVMARSDAGPERYLAAYVVAHGAAPTITELRAFLRDRLPDYMIPSAFVFLERMPMTSNGKVDRKALPAPALRRDDVGGEYVAPRTDTERVLAEIFARVLGVDRCGVTDNFFDLGGHSLRGVQVIHQVEQALGQKLSVSALLQAPTAADLAEVLASADRPSVLVPLREGNPTLYCFHPSGGEVLTYRPLLERLPAAAGVVAVRSQATAGAPEHASIDEMADHYATALLERGAEGAYHLLGWSMGGVIAHAVAERLEAAGHDVAFLGLIDASLPAENPAVRDHPAYRLGAALGPLAGHLADVNAAERDAVTARLLAVPEAERVAEVLRWAHERGAIPPDTSAEALERQVALFRTHDRLLARHRAGRVRAAVDVWWAEQSHAGSAPTDWTAHTDGAVRTSVLPGNHYSIVQPPALDEIAQRVADRLQVVGLTSGGTG